MTLETGAFVFATPAPGPSAPERINRTTHMTNNSKIAGMMERFLKWSTRVPPGVS
jgi:hypothetical protein